VHKLNTNVQLNLHVQLIQLSVQIYHVLYHQEIVFKIFVKLDNSIVMTENVLIIKKNAQLDQFALMNTQFYV